MRAPPLLVLLVLVACKEKPRLEIDAARDPVAAIDSGPEVERGPDIADALAALEALDEAGVAPQLDSGPTVDVSFGTAKVTPKGAIDPSLTFARNRFRFRSCARSMPDAGATKVLLTLKIGEGGEVSTVKVSDKTAFGECLVEAAKRVKFEEPSGGVATIEVPIEMVRR